MAKAIRKSNDKPLTLDGLAKYNQKVLFPALDKRFEKIDKRFEKVDERFEKIDGRFEKIDGRFEKIEKEMKKNTDKILSSNDKLMVKFTKWEQEEKIGILIYKRLEKRVERIEKHLGLPPLAELSPEAI